MNSELDGIGATFDHAAVAAQRIRDLLPVYQDLLGGTFLYGGDNSRWGFRWLQLAYPDRTKIELLEALPGSAFLESFFARTSGRGGPHHVTFAVRDIEAALDRLSERGYRPHAVNLDDPSWREAFLHPKETHGTLVQLAQPGASYPPASGLTLDDVLTGRGEYGTGTQSP
ncbi:MAG: VOC family protein [Streptosporangiaceae bacterium]